MQFALMTGFVDIGSDSNPNTTNSSNIPAGGRKAHFDRGDY